MKREDRTELFLVLAPILSGILASVATGFRTGNKIISLIAWVVTVILICVFIYHWTRQKKDKTNSNFAYLELDRQVNTYERILSGLITENKRNTKGVNALIHEIETEGRINLNIWNFDDATMNVCDQVFKALSYKTDKRKFGVSYVKLIEDGNDNQICMTGFANWHSAKPSIYGKRRIYNGDNPDKYYDAELFRKNSADISILMDSEEILKHFEFSSKDKVLHNKYSQYIGIPVICNDQKMIGLLEIVCFDGCTLSDKREMVEEIADKYLIPFAYYLLLLHKLEKAIIAMPDTIS